MALESSATHYGTVEQGFHWVTAVIVLAAFLTGLGGPDSRLYSSDMATDRQIHETLGICVLVLTLLRLVWRHIDPTPETVTDWRIKIAARMVEGLIYLLLLALPISAITGLWLTEHPISAFGLEIVLPVSNADEAGETILDLHKLMGDTIMYLAGAHALAAIFHHFILRDGVLDSMLPWKR